LEAARTKWNFLNFFPGLVGGHCIGVDPYYLSYKAKEYGFHAQIINAGRSINDNMAPYISSQIVKKLLAEKKNLNETKALVLGITFKENVSDIRNSKVADLISELQSYTIQVDVTDAYAEPNDVLHEYAISLISEPKQKYDVIILAVSHQQYLDLDETYFLNFANENALFVDIKGVFKNKIKTLKYWSL
jgi:UDP-N-acetyl-D-galactosamine dehydrogenase